MQPAQNVRCQIAVARQTLNTSVVTGGTIDCKGYDSATFVMVHQSANTSATVGSVSLEHSDTTDSTAFSEFASITSGLGTNVDSTALTNVNAYGAITVNLRGKKRYLRMKVANSIATTAAHYTVCLLDDPAIAPVNATQSGVKFIRDIP